MQMPSRFDRFRQIFRFSTIALPYLSYFGIVGLLADTIYLWRAFRRSPIDPPLQTGLLWISGLMVISSCFAFDRGEAFLQLINYFPYFLLFAVLPYFLRASCS